MEAPLKVDKYDGQCVWVDGEEAYELTNWLGGGASGVVYEAADLRALPSERNVAIKILNPCGYKLISSSALQRCAVVRKGELCSADKSLTIANVWWLVNPSTKEVIAAYEDPCREQLRELPLPKCIEVWGWKPAETFYHDCLLPGDADEKMEKMLHIGQEVFIEGFSVVIPRVVPKYLLWLKARSSICREISNMYQLGEHPNVVKLHEVLELTQDSKSTLFLVLELVTGGELFDRMKTGAGTPETLARTYFRQLLLGINYCHKQGVCHRDLKPENLLLSDSSGAATLKIADFGLSAVFLLNESTSTEGDQDVESVNTRSQPAHATDQVRRLTSIVGSPHYVAPEIVCPNSQGYDGRKVDSWSAGVILYAMLSGSLPFGKDLTACPRFRRFKKWVGDVDKGSSEPRSFPAWLFPSHLSNEVKALMADLLHPEPTRRLPIDQALQYAWLAGTTGTAPIPPVLSSAHHPTRAGTQPLRRSPTAASIAASVQGDNANSLARTNLGATSDATALNLSDEGLQRMLNLQIDGLDTPESVERTCNTTHSRTPSPSSNLAYQAFADHDQPRNPSQSQEQSDNQSLGTGIRPNGLQSACDDDLKIAAANHRPFEGLQLPPLHPKLAP